MATFRPSSTPKAPDLDPQELAALRDVSRHHSVEARLLRRLEKVGLIEQKSGAWATTQQGHIFLMFRAAK
jgi:ribosomal protein S19E (S16A)